jgi:hypothetical protein
MQNLKIMSDSGAEFIANRFAQPVVGSGVYVLPANRQPEQKTFNTNFPELGLSKTAEQATTKPKLAWNTILTQNNTVKKIQPQNQNTSRKLRVVDISDQPYSDSDITSGPYPKVGAYLKAVYETEQNKKNKSYDHLFDPPTPEESELEVEIEEEQYDDYEFNSEEEEDYVDEE